MSNFHEFLRPGEDPVALQHIMETEKVTLPIARNYLKMRKLGMKPSTPMRDPSNAFVPHNAMPRGFRPPRRLGPEDHRRARASGAGGLQKSSLHSAFPDGDGDRRESKPLKTQSSLQAAFGSLSTSGSIDGPMVGVFLGDGGSSWVQRSSRDHTDRDREGERQSDRYRERRGDRERDIGRDGERQSDRYAERQGDRDYDAGRDGERHADRHLERRGDRDVDIGRDGDRYADRYKERRSDRDREYDMDRDIDRCERHADRDREPRGNRDRDLGRDEDRHADNYRERRSHREYDIGRDLDRYEDERDQDERRVSEPTLADLFEVSGGPKEQAEKRKAEGQAPKNLGLAISLMKKVTAEAKDEEEVEEEEVVPEEQPFQDPQVRLAMIQAALQAEEERNKQHKAEQARKSKLHAAFQDDDNQDGDAGSLPANSAGSLMTEAQAKAMMRKKRRTNNSPVRGSARAQSRIQKERVEWETAKQNNPEYWKAPKFCQVLGKGTRPSR